MEKVQIEKFFGNIIGESITKIISLPASGSNRKYFRIFTAHSSYVVCQSSNIKENVTFLSMTEMLGRNGIKVPKVFGKDKEGELYILEDLGPRDLMGLIKYREKEPSLLWKRIEETISMLVKFQSIPKKEWKDIVEFDPFNTELIRHDFKYATDNLFEASGIGYDRIKLDKEFISLENKLISYPRNHWGLMYRDFQSRNIMLSPGPYFIDYQSARMGPGLYDLVSFSWQARAGFDDEDRERIISLYIRDKRARGEDEEMLINDNIKHWAAFRIIQTLGAYGLRGLKEGKTHFIESIPPALKNLKNLLEHQSMSDIYPELLEITNKLLKKYADR